MPQPLSIVRREPLTPPPVSGPARLSIVARAPLTEPYTAPDADPVRPVLADPVPPAVPDPGVSPPRPRAQGLATIGEQFWTKALQNARIAPAPKQPHPYAIVTDQTVKLAQDFGLGVLHIPKMFWGTLRAVGDGLGLESVAEYATAANDEVDRIAKRVGPDRSKAGTIEKGVSSGMQSLGATGPAILAATLAAGPAGPVVGGALVLTSMGLIAAGNAYDRARDEGLEPGQAAVYAATDGLVEVLTEKIPMARLLGDLAKNSGLMTMLTRQLAAEIPGEQVATLLQDANEWAHLNPEKTLSEFGAERPDAAAQTLIATVVGTVGQSAGAMAAQAVGSRSRSEPQGTVQPPATPVEQVPPTVPSAMPKASHKLTVVKSEPLTAQAPTLPPEFAPVDAPVAEPVSTAPVVDPNEPIDVMTDPVQAAQRMRAENPNIDAEAKVMAERAREVVAPPATEPATAPTPESTVPAPVAERMKANTPKTRQSAADYSGNVDDSPRVKNNEINRKHAFLMQWLADDLRQMPFEDSSRMRGIPAQDVTAQATSQEEARRAIYAPRVAGTPTQEMFAKLGVTRSRAEIATQIENYLSGRSRGGKAVDVAKALAPIFEAAYDVQTKRFDFRRVHEDLYRRAGLTYKDMRAPVTGPREDGQPADLIAAFFPGSTPKSQAPEDVRARANAQVADDASLTELVEQYRSRMRRDFGNVVSRDNAKELFDDYAASNDGRRTYNDAVADAAGAVADHVYRRELKRPAQPHAYVVMTGGGTGSGKTTVGVNDPYAQAADVVFDSQGRDREAMKRRIDAALASGRDVQRIYVYRAPGDAWIEGVVKRAVLEGRPVGMEDHIASHREALQAALALTEQYADDPRVRLTVVDNTGEQNRLIPAGEAVQFLRERLKAYNADDVREAVRELTDLARDSGLIDEDLYATLTRGAASADRRGRGEGAERRGRGGEERSARAEVQGAERPVQGAALEVTARKPLDINEFGESQARLPGAESVRGREVATPEATEVPFSLVSEVAETKAVEPSLFERQEAESAAYEARSAPLREAGKTFRQAQADYRAKKIGDAEYLAARKVYEQAQAEDEARETAFHSSKGSRASVGAVGPTTENPIKTGSLPKGFGAEQPGLLPVDEQRLTFDTVRPIEFPELVDLARELSQTPQVVKRFRGEGRLGEFDPNILPTGGKGQVRLAPHLFQRTADFTIDTPIGSRVFDPKTKTWSTLESVAPQIVLKREDGSTYSPDSAKGLRVDVSTENLRQLTATLAHEIGHLVDWLPDKSLKRGNLLGRLRSLRKFLRGTFTAVDGSTVKDREIRAELKAVSKAWRPWDESTAKDSFKRYRNSAEELYADALSVLFNSPGLLQERAPKFYAQFFAELDRKPDVKQAYFTLQELLSGTREELIARRRAGVRGMFEGADAKAIDIEKLRQEEAKAARKHLWQRIRIQHVDKNTPIIDRVKAVEKRGQHVPVDEDPRYFLEERNYIGGKQKAFVEKHFQPVYKALQEADIDWHTFGEALFYERIVAGDRSEVANPRGITPDVAKELYADLQRGMDAEQMATLGQAVTTFRAAVNRVAEDAFQAGLYKPELYEQMKENPAYAAFRVVEYLEKDVTSKVHHQIGTLKDVQNVADATILKTLVTLRAIEYQRMKVATFNFLHEHFPEDIQQAKQVWNGKGIVPVEPEDPKKQVLVYYYDQGKLRGKYVDPYIADSLNNESVGGNWAVVAGLRWINSKWFRPVFTSLNLGFQTFNLGRDFLRFWKNTPGMTFRRAMQRYYEAVPLARARAFGLPDNPNAKLQQAYTDMVAAEEARVLSTTFNDLIDGREIAETQIEDIFAKTGVTMQASAPDNKAAAALVSVINWIKKAGNFVESLPKAAGVYEFKGQGAIRDIPADQRSFIRRKIGSPDFLAGGTYKPVSNELLLFSNAITQAIRADLEVAREPKTRAGFWWKTAALNVAPKLALFAALYGIDWDEDDDWVQALRGITEYDLTNYLPIPLGVDEQGNSIYLRFPQDDFGRLMGGLVWKTLQGLRGDKEALQATMQVFDYTAGQVPGVTPILSLGKDVATLAAGGNVYDDFRNRFLFTDNELAARDGRTITKFLAYEFQQLGGGLFWKFSAGGSVPRDTTATQEILELPIVSNIVGRWIRVTNFGELERLRQATQTVRRDEARTRLAEREAVQAAIKRYQQLPTPQRTTQAQQELARDVVRRLYPSLSPADRVKEQRDVLKKIRMGAARGSADPYVDALIGARSTEQRVAVMVEAAESMGDQAFRSWLARLRREQVVSEAVITATTQRLRQRTATR